MSGQFDIECIQIDFIYGFTIYAIYVPNSMFWAKKIPPHAEGPSCKKLYTSNYFLAAVSTAVESAATAVESTATAAVSTVAAAVSVVASVEAPPQAANAAIAKIANTFFIFRFF
jgi:hypothetical protein